MRQSRRQILKAGFAGVVAVGGSATAALGGQTSGARGDRGAAAAVTAARMTGPLFFDTETTNGVVRGMATTGIKMFRGIPYGADTGGRNRFMPPRKPAAWTGARNCIGYGPISPQTAAGLRSDYSQLIQWDKHIGTGGMSEDCLSLNVWTPGVNDNGKRAVLVSFHGGGWATGSGNGPMYDGGQLALLGDVVVVTVNHRLASFGYTHLAALGAPEEFKFAGVCGVMDMVASLEWVRDNIAAFGGDPSRVMIFGQSGGGSKTSTLLATPAARGLFHRAVVQSGSTLRLISDADAEKSADLFLKKLGVARNRVADLQRLPWEQLLQAQTEATGAVFTPVVDGKYLPHHPFDPSAPPESRDVPVIIATTLEDAALRLTNWDLTDRDLAALLNERFKGKGAEILELYRPVAAGKTPYLVQAQVFTDTQVRSRAIAQAERKAAQGGAPAWMYIWEWATPAFDGKLGAVHGHDVDASFNLYRNGICGTGEKTGRLMAKRLGSTFIAFAKTGNPDNDQIPHWPAYDASARATMIFDTNTRVVNDPRSAIRKYWSQNAQQTDAGD
ncbi:MAG TPA: carboxylesterase family protein [Vicinamibacterales bacterium]|jgi:para-nitrobenzyl esterase|nr:carboxylesterase family protein [Vicinamibacterales bacterium]